MMKWSSSVVYFILPATLTLCVVVSAKDFEERFKRGRDLHDSGRFHEAYAVLNEAFELKPDNPGVNFYLGKTALALEDYENAVMAFDRILISNPNLPPVKLELAKTYSLLGVNHLAMEYLQDVLKADPPPEIRLQVEALIAKLKQAEKRHFLIGELTLGLSYDTNVQVSPKNEFIDIVFLPDPVAIEKKRDFFGFATLFADHRYRWLETAWSWRTSFITYNSFYETEKDLDTNYYSVLSGPVFEKDRLSLALQVFFTHLDKDYATYVSSFGATSAASFVVSKNLLLRAALKVEDKAYDQPPERDAINAVLTAGPSLAWGPNILTLQLGAETENATDDVESYRKYFASVRYSRRLPFGLTGYTSYRYQNYSYDEQNPMFAAMRDDRVHEFVAGLIKRLSDNLFTEINHSYTESHSTLDLYEYERNVTTVSLTFGF